MPREEHHLSQEKYDELKKELDYLTTVTRKKNAENLEYARSLGDLSENAEYQEAREMQAATEERIRKLTTILQSAHIVTEGKRGSTISLGSSVVIQKEGDKNTHRYMIVGSEEANMIERKISHFSPMGEALMGKKKGESFTFDTPNGKMKYKIVDVE